jgi:hypothetical protein
LFLKKTMSALASESEQPSKKAKTLSPLADDLHSAFVDLKNKVATPLTLGQEVIVLATGNTAFPPGHVGMVQNDTGDFCIDTEPPQTSRPLDIPIHKALPLDGIKKKRVKTMQEALRYISGWPHQEAKTYSELKWSVFTMLLVNSEVYASAARTYVLACSFLTQKQTEAFLLFISLT